MKKRVDQGKREERRDVTFRHRLTKRNTASSARRRSEPGYPFPNMREKFSKR